MRGGKLYYADGSVMHEGMYFEKDRRLTALCDAPIWTVEQFRKGFADSASPDVRSVPAITGALMVLDRRLYDRMGGFNTDIIYGHYEDADLFCASRTPAAACCSIPRWHIGTTKEWVR